MSPILPPHRRIPAAAAALALALAGPAFSQTAPPPEIPPLESQSSQGQGASVVLPAFDVTGTNIQRTDVENALPVLTMDTDIINVRDAFSPADLIQGVPQVVNMGMTESYDNNPGHGDYEAMNLRGLGSSYSLALLNGRRMIPNPVDTLDEGVIEAPVNISQIPIEAASGVDVLLDGASSIYGTDAIAGVVNFKTDDSFTGDEMTVKFGESKYGDGAEGHASIKDGRFFDNGRGHTFTVFDYYHREPIYTRDRSYLADRNETSEAPPPWNNTSPSGLVPPSANNFNFTGNNTLYSNFTIGGTKYWITSTYYQPENFPYLFQPGAVPMVLTTTAPVKDTAPYAGYTYAAQAYNSILPLTNRYNLYNSTTFDINSNVTAFSELMFYYAKSTVWESEQSYVATQVPYEPALVIPATAPFNATGQPITVLNAGLYPDYGPTNQSQVTNVSYRYLAGLRGQIANSTWKWEIAAFYNSGYTTDIDTDGLLLAPFYSAVESGAYDPLDYNLTYSNGVIGLGSYYRNSQSVINTFFRDERSEGASALADVDFHASGNLVQLWSGPLQMAFGAEQRLETYGFDNLIPPSLLYPVPFINASANWSADRTVSSAYGEWVIPITSPKNAVPLFDSLNITASVRRDYYSDFGTAAKPKVGFDWRPVDWIIFRGSYNQGYRAPPLPTLYSGATTVPTFTVTDPIPNVSEQATEIEPGNPSLRPEQSQGKSLGAVVDVPKVKGLSFSVDYWAITVDNVIQTPTPAQVLALDAADLAPIVNANPGVPFSQLPLHSGTSSYVGSPLVVRNPADNSLESVTVEPYNGLSESISGYDLGMRYYSHPTPWGRFEYTSDWTYLNKYTQEVPTYPNSPVTVLNNLTDVGANTRWHGADTLTWHYRDWVVGIARYYVSKAIEPMYALPVSTASQLAATQAIYQQLGAPNYIAKGVNEGLPYYDYISTGFAYYNVFVEYTTPRTSGNVFLRDTTVRVGLDNAFNKKPPLGNQPFIGTGQIDNTGPLIYGLEPSVAITRRF